MTLPSMPRQELSPGELSDRNGLLVMSRTECLAALGSRDFGRIGITDRAMPVILPVNYALLEDDIVFATEAGSKLDAAVLRAVVAFEVDEVDDIEGPTWSVCVTGVAEELVQPDDVGRAARLGLRPLIPSARTRHVRIRSNLISGRRLP